MSPRVLESPEDFPPNVGDLLIAKGEAWIWDGDVFVSMGPADDFLSGSNKDVMEGKPTAASTVIKPSDSSE